MTNGFAYLRVSGKGQVDGDGFDRQREAIAHFASSREFQIVREFREEGVSGDTGEGHQAVVERIAERPAFQEMVTTMIATGCRTVIVERLDRLSRSYTLAEQIISYLAAKEISVVVADSGENVTAAMLSDPMKAALVRMQGVFAQLEKDMLVRKLSKARARRKLADGKCEGRKAFGQRDGEGGALTRMVELRRHGLTWQEVADGLNREGVTTRYGGRWHAATVRKIVERSASRPRSASLFEEASSISA